MSYTFAAVPSLIGPNLVLDRVTHEVLPDLGRALISPDTWFARTRRLHDQTRFVEFMESMLARQDQGECLTLVARLRAAGEITAMSTFQYPGPGFRKVEIGFSWIADRWQKTFVNPEMKFLMLEHAFKVMQTNRVEFAVHPTNLKSNAAMKKLGAKLDGTLRKWRTLPGLDDGDRNIYSLVDDEWPGVREQLAARLNL